MDGQNKSGRYLKSKISFSQAPPFYSSATSEKKNTQENRNNQECKKKTKTEYESDQKGQCEDALSVARWVIEVPASSSLALIVRADFSFISGLSLQKV